MVSSFVRSPPTMKKISPDTACGWEPSMGVSMCTIERRASPAAASSVASGLTVEQSHVTRPAAPPAATPPAPRYAVRTISSFGRQVKSTLTWPATSAGDPAAVTPACFLAAATAAGLVSKTVSGTPALARLATMGPPIVPRPMKPTRSPVATSGDPGPALGPRPDLLERGGRLQHGGLGEAPSHDLQSHGQAGRREAGGHRRRGLAREVEGVGERGPREPVPRVLRPAVGVELADAEGRDGHRRREQQVVALEERAHAVPEVDALAA